MSAVTRLGANMELSQTSAEPGRGAAELEQEQRQMQGEREQEDKWQAAWLT